MLRLARLLKILRLLRFKRLLEQLGLEALGFSPCSVRRGGAIEFFRVTGNINTTMFIGRWQHTTTARTYLQLGLRNLVSMEFSLPVIQRLQYYAALV